jgi:hypothetical protein
MQTNERTQAQTRLLTFEIEGRASDDAIPVVVSSDAVVEVSDGPEVLVHSVEAIDLQRAPLPIIATHRGGQVNVGLVDELRVVNGQLRGMARFGVRQEAADYRADVLNRIIRSVSVGYARVQAKYRPDGVLVTSRWLPPMWPWWPSPLTCAPASTATGVMPCPSLNCRPLSLWLTSSPKFPNPPPPRQP